MTTTKERPILFSTEMIRAILDGRKTQTRRVVKPQPGPDIDPERLRQCRPMARGNYRFMGNHDLVPPCEISLKPFALVGDRLWVKEAWVEIANRAWYRESPPTFDGKPYEGPWRSPIFLPRRASRITLEVTGVKVERVNDISPEDAEAEGVFRHIAPYSINKVFRSERKEMAVRYFRELWDSINGKGSWALNPWVWAVSFRRVEK